MDRFDGIREEFGKLNLHVEAGLLNDMTYACGIAAVHIERLGSVSEGLDHAGDLCQQDWAFGAQLQLLAQSGVRQLLPWR